MAPSATQRATQPSQSAKLMVSLKPIQPVLLWTFDGVLSLLRNSQSQYVVDAVDEFLLLNSAVIKNPQPFSSDSASKIASKQKDFSVREVLYSGASEKNITDAEAVAKTLHVDALEALRIILQTSARIPEEPPRPESINSKLPDDSVCFRHQQRLHLYAARMLQERRTVLQVVIELLHNKSNPAASSIVQNLGRDLFLSRDYCAAMISTIGSLANTVTRKAAAAAEAASMDALVYTESVATLIASLKVLVELVTQNPNNNAAIAVQWFRLMQTTGFMSSLAASVRESEAFMVIEAISTVVSVVLLDTIVDSEHDKKLFSDTNAIVASPANQNVIILFYWSTILYRKQIAFDSDESQVLTDFSSEIGPVLPGLQARCLGVYLQLCTTAGILRFDCIYAAVLSQVLVTALPVVSMTPEVSLCIQKVLSGAPPGVIQGFFDDPGVQQALIVARAKFPLLLAPFLNLASISGTFALHEFNELKSYMAVLKRDELEAITEIDDNDTELVKLTEMLDIFPPFEENKKLSLLMANGTKAKVLPAASDNEALATFLYKFNGWSLMGRVLQNLSKNFVSTDKAKTDAIVNIVDMVTRVVEQVPHEDTRRTFAAMSAYTDNADILEVIFRLFEQSLHSRNVSMIASLLRLLTPLVPVFSPRMWPALSKSALLHDGTREGFAAVIFGLIEMVNGDFEVTIALAKLTDALVYDGLSLDTFVPKKVKEALLKKLVTHLVAVMESYAQCNFRSFQQKMEAGVVLLDTFRGVLASVYGIKHHAKSANDNHLLSALLPAAETLLSAFTHLDYGSARCFYPIIAMVESLSDGLTQYELLDCLSSWYLNWIQCSLSFAQLVISIRTSLRWPVSPFELALFKQLPHLVSAYASHEALGNDILNTLTALADGASGSPDASRLSMLSHLGREQSKVLQATVIADLENLLDDHAIKISLYDFLCAVFSGRQEGLAVLLSGRNVFGETDTADKKDVPLVRVLKRKIEDIRYYPLAVSLHLVDAVNLVFSLWSTVRELENDVNFVNQLLAVAQEYSHDAADDSSAASCYRLKLCSKVVEILSSFLYSSTSESSKNAILEAVCRQEFVDKVSTAISIHGYNTGLHERLEAQFETLLPFHLNDFAAALTKRNRFGPSAVYNFVLLDKLLPSTPSGEQLRKNIDDASTNLQHAMAQIALCKSYGALITSYVQQTKRVDSKVFGLVLVLLRANAEGDLPQANFEDVYYERALLAFFILYSQFSNDGIREADHSQILAIVHTIHTLLSSKSTNLVQSLAEGKRLRLHAPLLRMLFCCLSAVQADTALIAENQNLFRDIFELIVAKATNLVLILVQNSVYQSRNNTSKPHNMDSQLDSMQLSLTITKVFTKMKTSDSLKHEFAAAVESHGTILSLLNLYSFSHGITVDGEHVFAQLSLMFVQELMTMDVLARKFVDKGLLLVLVESVISTPIVEGGITIMNAPNHHRIWTNGILPILLAALHKLGPLVLPGVCYDLKFFRKQIALCIDSWSRDAGSIRITTALVSETSQLLLLYKIISGLLTSNVAVLPGLDTEENREEFAECLNNLLKHPKFLSSRVAPSSPEELKLWETKDASAMATFVGELIEEIRELKDMIE